MANAEKVQAALTLYEHERTIENLADYFSKLREAEENGEIDDDAYLNGLALVEQSLWGFAKVVHGCRLADAG